MQHHYAEAFPSHGAVFSEHCHFHVSHAARSHIVRALPGLWYGIAVLPCFSASGEAPVTRCGLPLRGTYAAYCPQPPAPKGGLSREEEMKKKGCRSPVTPSAPLMLIYFFQMLPFLVQLFAKSLNVDIRRVLFLDCALLELAAFAVAGKRASPFFCSCNTSRNGRLINAKLICYLAHAPTALKV